MFKAKRTERKEEINDPPKKKNPENERKREVNEKMARRQTTASLIDEWVEVSGGNFS